MRNLSKVAKVSPAQVLDIKRRYQAGETQSSLCREFGLSIGQIGRIVRGESWGHLGRFAGISDVDIQASMERFRSMMGHGIDEPAPSASGFERLQQELERKQSQDDKADEMLKELDDGKV